MYRRRTSRSLALATLTFVAACARTAVAPGMVASPVPPPLVATMEPMGPPRPDPELLEVDWAKALPPLHVECANTGAKADVRLYKPDGTVDAEGVDAFSDVAADANGRFPLNPRLVQLAVKAAHHFGDKRLVVVSGYRKGPKRRAPDHHAKGEALDFRLAGVDYRKLAAYLRGLPRVGVGVYTNPKTQFVHLDVRDLSFHWLDASPPGVTWREARLPDAHQVERDATYRADGDLPL
jgi:uncharacterized protein YcbK (DUF882 family)